MVNTSSSHPRKKRLRNPSDSILWVPEQHNPKLEGKEIVRDGSKRLIMSGGVLHVRINQLPT